MVQKLSTFLSSSLVEAAIDSASVRTIVQSETIKLDSGTSGDYIKTLSVGPEFNITSSAHALDATITMDSNHLVHLTGTQTLRNKTINLSNNTLTGTLSQFSAAVSGDALVGLAATQTLTNKTLTSPTINQPTITGPLSITDISTFGLRDISTTTFETRLASNNVSPTLSADRTLTLDVNNANRSISLTGDLTLAGAFTTSGAHNTTLTTTGTTDVTLPTSGFILAAADSAEGTITANVVRSSFTTVSAGSYGSATAIPVITVNASGFVDSVGTAAVSGVSGVNFDSATGTFTVQTAITNFSDVITLDPYSTSDLSEGTNQYFTNTRARGAISVTDNGGPGSLGYTSGTGVLSYTGPTGAEILTEHLRVDGAGTNLDADKLDGQQGSYYRINVYNAAGTLLN